MSLLKSFKNSPKWSIKWNNFFDIYENIFQKFKGKKITFVEVGVGDGGSLFMWKKFFGKKAKIIGIELNPEAKKLKKFGFEIHIGDQTDKNFWKNFYKKVGKIDILLDDGGHKNIQTITTLMGSINHINNNGLIVVEDTQSNYIKKAFKNPSKYSFINFCSHIIENIHRKNPSLKKKINDFSKNISSIQFFNSVIVFYIDTKNRNYSKLIENNRRLRNFYIDFRHDDYFLRSLEVFSKFFGKIKSESFLYKVIRKLFHRNIFFSINEKLEIKKYIKILKK